MKKHNTGTTQATYVNRGPSIYHPLVYMDRPGTKPYHLFNHLGTTDSLAGASGPPWRPASGRPSRLASSARALTNIRGPQLGATRAGASCAIGLLSSAGDC